MNSIIVRNGYGDVAFRITVPGGRPLSCSKEPIDPEKPIVAGRLRRPKVVTTSELRGLFGEFITYFEARGGGDIVRRVRPAADSPTRHLGDEWWELVESRTETEGVS